MIVKGKNKKIMERCFWGKMLNMREGDEMIIFAFEKEQLTRKI